MDGYLFYMFKTAPQKERQVARFLRGRGHHAIVPIRSTQRRSSSSGSGKRALLQTPACPGYVFIARPQVEPALYELFRYQAIKSVVGFNGEPAGIKAKVMEDWISVLQEKPKAPDTRKYNKGDSVKLKEGAFAGFPAVIEKVRGNQAHVLVYLFGRPTEVHIAVEHLVVSGPSSDGIRAELNNVLTSRRESTKRQTTPRPMHLSRPETGRKKRSA